MTVRRFTARHSELDAIRAFIETSCAGMSRDDQYRLVLLVEELFTNSVMHGYGRECDDPVWLTLEVSNGVCRVMYEDEAVEYDPFAAPAHAMLDAEVEDRPVGGLGILLLTEMSSSYSYTRRGARNVIEFELPLGPGPGSATAV